VVHCVLSSGGEGCVEHVLKHILGEVDGHCCFFGFLILRVFLLRFFSLFRVFESSFFGLLFFVVNVQVVVGFVAWWCFPEPLAFVSEEVRAGFGIARVVGKLIVFPKPTASVATGVTMCLWRNGVGGAAGDRVG